MPLEIDKLTHSLSSFKLCTLTTNSAVMVYMLLAWPLFSLRRRAAAGARGGTRGLLASARGHQRPLPAGVVRPARHDVRASRGAPNRARARELAAARGGHRHRPRDEVHAGGGGGPAAVRVPR